MVSSLCMYELELLTSPLFEWPPCFHYNKASNFAFCLLITLWCLHSMTLFIKVLHSSKVTWSSSLDNILFHFSIHVILFNMSNSSMLLIDLMCSLSSCFSAFLIIWMPLDICTLVLSLTFTDIISHFRHLIVNHRWFL